MTPAGTIAGPAAGALVAPVATHGHASRAATPKTMVPAKNTHEPAARATVKVLSRAGGSAGVLAVAGEVAVAVSWPGRVVGDEAVVL
jgi:hypothetical protein